MFIAASVADAAAVSQSKPSGLITDFNQILNTDTDIKVNPDFSNGAKNLKNPRFCIYLIVLLTI